MRITKTFRNGECHTLRPCCARYYTKLSKYEDKEEELNMSFDEMASFIKIIKKHKDTLTPAIINGKNASFVLTISDIDTNDYAFLRRVLERK